MNTNNLTSQQIATVNKANEVYNFLFETWSKSLEFEMNSDSEGVIPDTMHELRQTLENAMDEVLKSAKGTIIKRSPSQTEQTVIPAGNAMEYGRKLEAQLLGEIVGGE